MDTSYDFLRLTVKGLQILWLMVMRTPFSTFPHPLTEEESWIRDVEQNATDLTATLAVFHTQSQGGVDQASLLAWRPWAPALPWQAALLPVGSWVVISLYSSRHPFSFPLANSQFPRTSILLPQRLCWGSVEYGRPSLAYRELTTQWSCFVLSPNHFPVPGIRIHTLQKPRSLLLRAWQALLSMCDLLVLLGCAHF